jgi:hypothetical protein
MDLDMWLTPFGLVAGIGAAYVGWWALGDFLLDAIGIPFLDAGSRGAADDRDAATTWG